PVTFHVLRHTHASHLAMNGVGLGVIPSRASLVMNTNSMWCLPIMPPGNSGTAATAKAPMAACGLRTSSADPEATGNWQKPPFMALQPDRHASTNDSTTWSDYAWLTKPGEDED